MLYRLLPQAHPDQGIGNITLRHALDIIKMVFFIQYDLFSVGETILKDHGRRGGTDERRILGIIYDIRKD